MFRRLFPWLAVVSFGVTAFGAQITISTGMASHYSGAAGSTVNATASVISEFELRSVTATLNTQTVALAYSPAFNHWQAATAFDLSNAPSGTNIIRFTATDALGNAAQMDFPIFIDRLLTVEVFAPEEGALARPLLFVSALGQDDLVIPRFNIWSTPAGGFSNYEWFMHSWVTARPEGIIDLSSWEESQVNIHFQGFDRGDFNASVLHTRRVLSLSNPRYQPVLNVSGVILDVNSEAVLYVAGSGELVSMKRATAEATVLKEKHVAAGSLALDRLTATGALVYSVIDRSTRLLELNRGEEIDFGEYFSTGVFAVTARYGLIQSSNQVILRDFIARTNYVFPFPVSSGDVAANGTAVVLHPVDGLYRYAGGELTRLGVTNAASAQTDGTNVLWYGNSSLHLTTPETTITVGTNVPGYPLPTMRGGWIAFPRLGTQGQQQIWLRSPAGEVSQATFYAGSSQLKHLHSDGSLVVSAADTQGSFIAYIRRGEAPKRISRAFGATYFQSGTNVAAFCLGSLFHLNLEGEPIGLSSPQYDDASGVLTYFVTASAPGPFTLQRSIDLVQWAAVTGGAVTNTLPTKFQVSTAPGFFRVRRNEPR